VYIWEVATWEIANLGSCCLGKCPWEIDAEKNVFEKVPNFDLTVSLEKLINFKYFGTKSFKNHLYDFFKIWICFQVYRYLVNPFP